MGKKIIGIIVLVFIGLQFFVPEKNKGDYQSITDFEQQTQMPLGVKKVLEAKCYDCHSANTNYPWYASITPISFWLAEHIEHGKEHFDISQWDTYSKEQKSHKLEELIEMIEKKEMPLPSYTWIHGNLTDQQTREIISWAENIRKSL